MIFNIIIIKFFFYSEIFQTSLLNVDFFFHFIVQFLRTVKIKEINHDI